MKFPDSSHSIGTTSKSEKLRLELKVYMKIIPILNELDYMSLLLKDITVGSNSDIPFVLPRLDWHLETIADGYVMTFSIAQRTYTISCGPTKSSKAQNSVQRSSLTTQDEYCPLCWEKLDGIKKHGSWCK